MPRTIWFNKNFSSLYNIVRLIKEGDAKEDFRILCTHENPEFVGFEVADAFEVEDSRIGEAEYIAYCLDVCSRHDVSLFLPSKKMTDIARHREVFSRNGVEVLVCADHATLDIINDKAAFYAALSGSGLEIPEHHGVNTLQEFDEACAKLRQAGKRICFKPARSIYGLGFKIVKDDLRDIDAFLSGDAISVTMREAREKLASVERFRTLLVMEHLEGPEYSVDCLAKDGRLVRGAVREKPQRAGGAQLLLRNDPMMRMAETLTRRFNLSGLFNVQARCAQGIPKLLEINPRMAGGIYFSCLSGVNYPYWGIRLALESCEAEIPEARYGFRVNQVYHPFELRRQPEGAQ